MSFWEKLFGRKGPEEDIEDKGKKEKIPTGKDAETPASHTNGASQRPPEEGRAQADNRRIRVFISSTFRDMIAERDELMSHTWTALRRLCQERHVELVEVDLRWGISEEQSTRKETLKLCLDEIRACRPFFIGLLGERYGWVPGDDAFTADLREEQPWLKDLQGRSVTELEILHGVLNNPEMADRSFFYFRDPAYAQSRGADFLPESPADAQKQNDLKALIRKVCAEKNIALRENYSDPRRLAALVLDDLTAAIEARFPKEDIPDALTREAREHEAFAEIRRRTYIARSDYYEALDRHAEGDGGPLLLLGESGSGKSALIANWLERRKKARPDDFIIQHYIGGTADSSDYLRLMTRIMSEIKRCSGDPDPVPTGRDDILRDFPLWLAKARARAEHLGVRFIIVLDALNQLEEREHARLLGWLPEHPLGGALRLIASTLAGKPGTEDPLKAAQSRGWQELRVQPLTVEERSRMIAEYLARFGKKLDEKRLKRLAAAAPAANPLYLKILLDDLRVTGTYDRLDERLKEYLKAADIPALLRQVLARYQRDYERERPGLVSEALGLIYAARRGLSEMEILQLLRPDGQAQLPPALWAPLCAALEDSLVDRGGILNFAHDFLRSAVEGAFAAEKERRTALRLRLADYFEAQPVTARTCDELPWLLKESGSLDRLRACLLDIDRFLLIFKRDREELRGYWVEPLREQETMGVPYLESFETWTIKPRREELQITHAADELSLLLQNAALYTEAEPLRRRALEICEKSYGENHPQVAKRLNNLALLLRVTCRYTESEPMLRRALEINQRCFGENHPSVATSLNNLAGLLETTNRHKEAEPLLRRALEICEKSYGENHPDVAMSLNNLAGLLKTTNRHKEAEPLYRRLLEIEERSYGENHPVVAICLNNFALLLPAINRHAEAETLMRRALKAFKKIYGENHPCFANALYNLAGLLKDTNRHVEAEQLYRQEVKIWEQRYGENELYVARSLNSLASLLVNTNRLSEAEPLMKRMVEIFLTITQATGHSHPHLNAAINNYAGLLAAMGRSEEELRGIISELCGRYSVNI